MKKLLFSFFLLLSVISLGAQDYEIISISTSDCYLLDPVSAKWTELTPGGIVNASVTVKNTGSRDCELYLRDNNSVVALTIPMGTIKLCDCKLLNGNASAGSSFMEYLRKSVSRSISSEEIVYQQEIGGDLRGVTAVSGMEILSLVRAFCDENGVFDPAKGFETDRFISVLPQENGDLEVINHSQETVYLSAFSMRKNADGTVSFTALDKMRVYKLKPVSEGPCSFPDNTPKEDAIVIIATLEKIPPTDIESCLTSLCNFPIPGGPVKWAGCATYCFPR